MLDHEHLRDLTESYLKSLIAEESDSLHPDFDSLAAFGELGIDSFRVLKIIKKLEADFGTLPKSLLFENFNVNDLANYFVAKHEATLTSKFRSAAAEPPLSVAEAKPPQIQSGGFAAALQKPFLLPEKDAYTHPELGDIVRGLYEEYKIEGCVSRGTRKIAPNVFIGSDKRGYFNYARSKDLILVYGYTGPRDYLPALLEEIHSHCTSKNLQLNLLADGEIPPVGGVAFSSTPFGVLQRIENLKEFRLDGGPMRRLRYQVTKFQKEGACRTEEYRNGTSAETDRNIADVIERWCAARTMVNPLVHDVKAEILAGTLSAEHRLFLTYLNDVLQNVILITPMCASENGYLMDLEFYPPEMPMGGLEFAIVSIIETLIAEGCDVLSLGGTYGCKLEPSPNADPEIDKILDELRDQNIFNDAGNLQFKNKFRPENKTIYLSRPVGSANPGNVIDIIMMIADPEKLQTSDAENQWRTDNPVCPVPEEIQEQREKPESVSPASTDILAQYGFNPINLPHEHVEFDLKTDSWAQLQMPAIDTQMERLHAQLQQPVSVEETLRAVFPFTHFVLTHSGEAAENLFFKTFPNKGVVLQNLLFPSTIFHQIDKGFTPRELPHASVFELQSLEPYRGNLDEQALEAELARDAGSIAMVCIEVGDNASGGYPVSVKHLERVKALLAPHAIPLVLDMTRVVENAQCIIRRERQYEGKSVWTVVRDLLAHADAVIGSLTKDFCVDKGGIIATRDAKLFQRLQDLAQEEGGGLDLIDRKLIALSLQNRKHIEASVLRRMENVRVLAQKLHEHAIPVAMPPGGHCVLVDVKQIPEFARLREPVASFVAWLYSATGIRAAAHNAGMQKRTALNDLVRLAVPAGLKSEDVEAIAERFVRAYDEKANIPELTLETPGLHATYRLGNVHNAIRQIAPAPSVSEPKPRPRTEVAIVGMAGRYPKANNLREFWDNLAQGRDCIEEIPAQRYEWRLQHGSVEKYRGGFISDVDKFDSLFFNISPREAEMLDPQERLFLEVAWEAIEDAGYYPETLAREGEPRNIGVFVGAVWAMYQMFGVEEKHAGNKIVPNSFLWSIANRVSYCLNLSGPSLTVDTACSSSLTALHLAVEAIRSGDCSGAIVGGVNLDLHQAKYDINHTGGALSPDGVPRTFGKGANGYVMGEGIGALYLKPLDRAIADGDNIYGVIRSAVVNHGARTSGYTVPNPKAQAELVAVALEKANVPAASIGYIEAHGTGTELGDPIEITGLTTAFDGVSTQTCPIGSVKTNIGHLEAAAGVVSVSKVLLQMKHAQIAPSLHSSELNEFIDFGHSPFFVPQALQPWTPREAGVPLRAGVSSFGAGGSNAHIILESYEPLSRVIDAQPRELIFPLSARSEEQVREYALRLRRFIEREDEVLSDVAYTLQIGRKPFEHRLAIVAATREDLLARLDAFIDGKKDDGIAAGHVKSAEAVTRLLNRKEKEEFVRLLSQRREPRKLAELWAEGLIADWNGLQSDNGRRVSLPGYPFADRRHWAFKKNAARRSLQHAAGMHPLVDTNESTFERQIFKKTFHDRDFFIYDHLVADVPTLPGVAYLELARKAGELAAGRPVRKIRNILWVSPIAVQNAAPKDVFVELKPSGDSVQFEVFSEPPNGVKTLHSQGKLLYGTPSADEFIDLAAVRARTSKAIAGKDAYPLFHSLGLHLGASFQVLQEVYKNDTEVLGVLKLPEFRLDDLQDMLLHPSLVDGSLQAGMAAQIGEAVDEMYVPFSIGEVEILHPLQPDCYSYVTASTENRDNSKVLKTNVLILDATGKVLVRIKDSTGVPLRDVAKKSEQDADGFAKLYYAYDWQKAPIASDAAVGTIALFDTEDSLPGHDVVLVRPEDASTKDDFAKVVASLAAKNVENLCFAWPLRNDSLDYGVRPLLHLVQALIAEKLDGKVQLLVLFGPNRPEHEAMTGFINSLRLEHPKLLCKAVQISGASIVDAVHAEFASRMQDATAIRYENGERSVRKLRSFELEPERAALRENGVYLITGGAGGLGSIFAEFLAKEHNARVVLTGRSALSAERQAQLSALGPDVVYIAADVADRDDVTRLVAETRARFGAIHGVIHAAGVLRDSLVRNKTIDELNAVLAPKVYGTQHLDELTKDDELDFFVTFSSLAAVAGNAGQCDYSYANFFMDSFAAERERRRAAGERHGRSLSFNWSLWADGGMKLDAETQKYFEKNLGIRGLRADLGIETFLRGLASGRTQFAVLEGVQEKVEMAWGLKKKPTMLAAPSTGAAPAAVRASGGEDLAARLQDDLTRIIMELLKVEASDVDSDKILLDLGFDSIGLTTFANAVNDKFALDITPVLFFDYPSVGEISKYLAAERQSEIRAFYGGGAAPQQAAAPAATAETEAPIQFRKGWSVSETPAAESFSHARRFLNEPIAIVGMSGVMPMSEDVDAFWANLAASKDMISVIPEERWKWQDFYGDPLKEPNVSNSKWGGFMNEVDKFDPLFFGISPREAHMMDPQQRLFLQTVWKAIEDSGQKVSDLSGTKTGLFVGVATNDYIDVINEHEIVLDGYSASGNSHSVLANRVSFLLNLHGPSAPIDTACSSSLVALHRAIESIHTHSCDMAIVGGVQVMLSPAAYISFGAAGMLSPDGKCKTFDKRANGYVRGEGCGALFLKRLSDAEKDGNHIYAIVKSTAENHGGKVTTLTAPNSAAQAELLVEAYEKADVDPSTVGFIECHGTGTSLGDPIEIQALSKAFAELYKKRGKSVQSAHIGLSSVKTNIGHLETAAGIAGLLKTLLAIQHKQIPANLHFEEVNPYIKLDGTPFFIAGELTPWVVPEGQPRRAGVSSFGFGGANAHIVLEEYLPRNRQNAAPASEPQLLVLSAKNEQRLQAYVDAMLGYLDKHECELVDLAFTMQVGRDEMPERLAVVAESIDDLKSKLRAGEGFRGNAKQSKSEPAVDPSLIEKRDLAGIGELWVAGAKIDWRALYKSVAPRRIPAPTYPFARERYWIPLDGKGKGRRHRGEVAQALLHPLVHRNTSTLDEQKFSTRFTGSEFYLADHVVETQKILPGVAYLEMARAAGELSANAKVRVIRGLTWERPLIVDDAQDVEIALGAGKNNELKFSIRSSAGTHATGRLSYHGETNAEVLDIAAISRRCTEQVLTAEELYPFLDEAGLKLGAGFRIVRSIHATQSESLALLQLPQHLRETADEFQLHPALMDGSLHTAIGLMKQSGMALSLNLPYSVGEVQIFDSLRDLHYGYATWAGDPKAGGLLKVTFELLDKNGRVLVRMKDFVSRPFGNVPQPAQTAALQTLVPLWNRVAPASVAQPEHVVLFGNPSKLEWLRASVPSAVFLDSIADGASIVWIAPDDDDHEACVLALFRMIKSLQGHKKLQWTLVLHRTAHAGVIGLAGSMAKEFPQWDVRVVELDSFETVSARDILTLPFDKQGNLLTHRAGEWFQQSLATVTALPEVNPAVRRHGVYVVIGGAGGVGEVWSRFMIENYGANVVWIGRREPDAAIAAKIEALSKIGPAPLYIRADAANEHALEQARQTILEHHPAIHGVVHSAIVLQDQGLTRMDEATFRASFSAKADVSVNIDRVFGNDALDFVLFFSSIVSFVKSPGQSNYAAGCTFKDAFAEEMRKRRPYPVKTMNWGFWGDVGVVSDAAYKKTMAAMGIGSIEPAEGMAALQTLLASELPQLAVVKTLTSAAFPVTETVTHVSGGQAILPVLPEKPVDALESELPTPEMTSFVTEILAATLQVIEHKTAPQYQRWLQSSIRYLETQNLANVRPLDGLWSEWDVKRAQWATAPNLQAQIALLEACLRALPDVLTGKRLATDVMFPNSSMQLVEGIYRGNLIADHFNEILGDTLAACIEQRLQADAAKEIRILEIGAGTGGTTAKLLPLLQRYPVAEYCYTDVSRAFLMYAEKHFKPQLPSLTTAIFDVTKPLASQTIAPGHYDFAIAANVLHATPDIRETLRNAKAALTNGGVLLLNEIATWSMFNHLTFGLLEGWWLHEDTALRIAGSPGLSPEQWRDILAAEGFQSVVFPARNAHGFGQQIVAAASNGWTRQRVVKQTPKPAPTAVPKPAPSLAMVVDKPVPQAARQPEPKMSHDHIRQVITQTLSDALRLDAAMIRPDAPFADYGVDSIIGVNFVRTLCETLQIELETTSLFEYSTVEQLAGYIAQNFQVEDRQAAVSPAPALPSEEPRFARFAEPVAELVPQTTPAPAIEPIAVIGMSGRFAESDSLDAFWRNLSAGRNLVKPVTRWSASDCVMQEPADRAYCSQGSFIDGIDEFDPAFFGISTEEAVCMDPQQRLFLEESWKALEDAGYASKSTNEKQCGVYVGVGGSNYDKFFANEAPAQAFWGNSDAVVPARIAYHLNLQGPAIAIDTACSSSLVAIHLACQGLWSRETDMALAGGVFLQATPGFYQVANRAGMLSPTGQCRSFDANANGFVPGEGVGVIVLKRLRDAIADGDSIHGVIAGSGINQDGSSNGLIAPNGRAQERLERSVYDRFDLNPESIQVLEAHGTGTLLGDSVEYNAITRSFREYTDKTRFCAIGTVKTNIGHAATAAGIAGVLKLLLSMKHRQIPPSLHFEKGNPAIDLESGPFYVNTQLRDWQPANGEKRRAAISSFGFSGTNAHLVLEEPPAVAPAQSDAPAYLVVLSARSAAQLQQQARNLLGSIASGVSMNDLSFTLLAGRTHFSHRLSCIARNQAELERLLTQWLESGSASGVYTSELQDGRAREQASFRKFGNYCIQECRNAADAATYIENLAAIAELYVQGYALDYAALFPRDSKRIPLPAYPFAKEHYWVAGTTQASLTSRLHPLLHTNTSSLGHQSYTTMLSGAEPLAAAYLEMVRAAVEDATRANASVLELRDVVFAEPLALNGTRQVTISVFAGEQGVLSYEIVSGGHVHCQGRAVLLDEPAAPRNGGDYVLEPNVVKAALGATPRRIEFVRIYAACANATHERDGNGNIDIIDRDGIVCVEMRGVQFAASETEGTWVRAAFPVTAQEKIEQFLREEVARQLGRAAHEVPTNCSYFDLGLGSLALTHVLTSVNRLIGEELSPSMLFDYTDIESLAAYLAAHYGDRIAAADDRELHRARLTPLRQPELHGEQLLEQIVWEDASLDDSYEKVTF